MLQIFLYLVGMYFFILLINRVDHRQSNFYDQPYQSVQLSKTIMLLLWPITFIWMIIFTCFIVPIKRYFR